MCQKVTKIFLMVLTFEVDNFSHLPLINNGQRVSNFSHLLLINKAWSVDNLVLELIFLFLQFPLLVFLIKIPY
jgi:hypothetical protein